jgi:hypothetical protein
MIPNSPTDDSRTELADNLDRLLADFFQAQLTRPWPAAPATAEPSTLVAPTAAPRNQPAARDTNRTSRYTLAASVALLLGTCWYFSNGFQPPARPGSTASPGGLLTGAEASKPMPGMELRGDNAIKGDNGKSRSPLKLP